MRIIKILSFLVFLLAISELGLRVAGFGPAHKYHLVSTPRGIFKTDSLVGWELNKGSYVLSAVDSLNRFKVTINNEGNRITGYADTSIAECKKSIVQIYGCSFTFGFSVDDTATQSFKLQQMMPDVKIENKGVPAYGLTQMFLLLKESLAAGDTPTVAVFNYANFQDWRTPHDRSWSSLLGYAITSGYSPMFRDMRYPYMEIVNDSLQLYRTSFNDLSKDWPLREKSAVVNVLNTVVYGLPDFIGRKHLHVVSGKIAFLIMRYCKANHIIPVFASVTPVYSNDILNSLSAAGFYTLDYGIVVWDHRKSNKYNCGPLDPEHPNGLAHSIYARKLFDFLQQKHILCSR